MIENHAVAFGHISRDLPAWPQAARDQIVELHRLLVDGLLELEESVTNQSA